jgi:glycosyltransferase involved in cell wall biosynthesis
MTKWSVALCTYNGARFLPQQLASILRQSRLPDEFIIRDDRSTDHTPALIEVFRREAPFPVDFKVNEQNLGAKKNFEQAIFACRGELIALSDQDDIWHRDRLARSELELLDHPEAGLVFSDGEVIDDFDQPTGGSLWQSFLLSRRTLERLQSGDYLPLAQRTFVTGATVMFRSRFAPLCFPGGQHWWHDGWLAMLIAGLAEVRPIDAKLISYRSHHSQQIGLRDIEAHRWESLEEKAAKHAALLQQVHDSLVEVCEAIERLPLTPDQRTHGALDAFRKHRDFLALRLGLPSNRLVRTLAVLEAYEQYRVSARGLLDVAKDIVLPVVPPSQ